MISDIWKDGTGTLSWMRCALTPAVLACTVGIIISVIRGDWQGVAAAGAALTTMITPKAVQSFAEGKYDQTNKSEDRAN